MPSRRRFALLLGLLVALPASARADEWTSLPRRERGDLAIAARGILRKYCAECHGEKPIRDSVSVVHYPSLTAKTPPIPFVNIDDPKGRSQLLEFIDDGSMPPGGRPRPTEQEIETLRKWAAARSPSYPKAFDDATTLQVMLDDIDRQREKDADAVPYLRYVSLVRDGQPLPDLGAVEDRLRKALVAASGRPGVGSDPVDDTATLLRFDIRKLGWATPDLFIRVENGRPKPNDAYEMVAYDLVLLEYPHGFTLPVNDPLAARLTSFLKAARQLRPVPFVRADWLVEAIAPKSPLAEDLEGLVKLGEARAKAKGEDLMPCGPPARPFLGARPVKVAPVGGYLPVVPLGAWYGGDVAHDPDPFGLRAEAVLPLKGNKPTGEVQVEEPYRLRVTANRDLRFLLLNVLPTGDIRVQNVDGGTIIRKGESRLLGPEAGKPFKAGSLLTGQKSETEHWVLVASDVEVPAPVIVRSRHDETIECKKENRRPVWRFVFEPSRGGFDPNAAVRKVVPIVVKAKPQID